MSCTCTMTGLRLNVEITEDHIIDSVNVVYNLDNGQQDRETRDSHLLRENKRLEILEIQR